MTVGRFNFATDQTGKLSSGRGSRYIFKSYLSVYAKAAVDKTGKGINFSCITAE